MNDLDRLADLLEKLALEAGLDPADERALALLAIEEGHPEVAHSLLSRAQGTETDQDGPK